MASPTATTDDKDETWTFLLTAGRERKTVTIAADAAVAELYQVAASTLGVVAVQSLQAGFPPKPLVNDTACTLRAAGLQDKERVTVVPCPDKGTSPTKAAASKRKAKKTTKAEQRQQEDAEERTEEIHSTSPSTVARPRSKRAAAAQATASFSEVIQAQDAWMKQQQSPQSPSKKRKASPKKQASPAKSVMFTAATTAGRRLQDGAAVAPIVVRQRRRKTPTAAIDSNQDPGEALLGTLHSTSTASRLMRKNWKQAVNSVYEQNQAVARLAAVVSGTCQLQLVDARGSPVSATDNDVDTENDTAMTLDSQLQVTYPKGVQGRGNYTDTVDCISVSLLQSVVAAIQPAEAARPENLCLLSPRVFWSLRWHFPTGSVEQALQQVAPANDWSFLRRRKQQLSDKARENLRQEQVSDNAAGQVVDYEAAAAAIYAVENAMGDLRAADRQRQAARAAAAALCRQRQESSTDNDTAWQLVTPTERDEDELRTCITTANARLVRGDTTLSVDAMVHQLLQHGITNWRVLANCSDELAANLAANCQVPISSFDTWMERAQQESLDEIIMEVCQDNVDAVALLRDGARSGTPKDLAAWRWIVDSLHQELVAYAKNAFAATTHATNSKEDEETNMAKLPGPEALQLWCGRAHQAVQQLEWLGMYTTPLE